MGTSPELARYEQRFRRAGLPLFIEDFSPTHDIFTRATPLLGFVFLAEMLGATSFKWPFWVNLLAVLGGLAVLIAGFAVLNKLRGRPFWSLPTRFGIPELATFVLLPALLPLLSEFQFRQFLGVAAGNLFLIGLVYAVVGYGLIGTTIGGLARLGTELAGSVASLVRALPLLLVFSLVLFMTADMWQVFAGMPAAFIGFVAIAFAMISNLFLVLRLPAGTRPDRAGRQIRTAPAQDPAAEPQHQPDDPAVDAGPGGEQPASACSSSPSACSRSAGTSTSCGVSARAAGHTSSSCWTIRCCSARPW